MNKSIKEQKDFYPFGKEHETPNLISSTNRWGFSGKEKQSINEVTTNFWKSATTYKSTLIKRKSKNTSVGTV
ncbi:MAG: hypothetical protein LBS69_11170 [Prevotellaceae bacterium]|jgi:hypothetical protein|nr:hypothetical protein [Prevotellaceae bacterium]